MRERLTAAFIVLSVVLLLGAGLVRTYLLQPCVTLSVVPRGDTKSAVQS